MIVVTAQSGRGDLLAAARERELSGHGTNIDIFARIQARDVELAELAATESRDLGPVTEDDPLGLDDDAHTPLGVDLIAEATAGQPPAPPEAPPAVTDPSPEGAAGGPVTPARPEAMTDPNPPRASRVGVFGNAFRAEYVIGGREVDDVTHFRLIEETQAAALAAGRVPRGGVGIGRRVGFFADDHGTRTVIYEVPIRRGA
jgi:hypothetical protein